MFALKKLNRVMREKAYTMFLPIKQNFAGNPQKCGKTNKLSPSL